MIMTEPHEYFYEAGDIRGSSPQDIREAAIDLAVGDLPDAGATYEVVPGYTMEVKPPDSGRNSRGTGRFYAHDVHVRITVPASQARWMAPGDEPSTGKVQAARKAGRP
jgi:hypothetical protein